MRKIINDGVAKMGLSIDENKTENLICYSNLLKEWNEKMNLTAITDDEGIATKHFLDSMTALLTGKVEGRVADVGCGAGFPGMVLKIMKPDIDLYLIDSLKKRLTFLDAVIDELSLDGVQAHHGRAEDVARQMRESFDTVVSRAVANMTVLSELCLPFVKVGGYLLALKGPLADEEIENAKKAIEILGGSVEGIFSCEIPFTELNHKIIIVKKVRHTPIKYPRKAGIPTKEPIGNCYNLKKGAK